MRALSRSLVMFLLAALIAACGSEGDIREEEPGTVRHAPRSQPRERKSDDDMPPAPKSIPPDAAKSPEDISGPAVVSLMSEARSALSANHPDQALPLLERAVRIEPRNAFVWQMLAKTHLALGHNEQAQSTAEKSNSLARGNPYVELENWKVIATTRKASGDANGAESAQTRVEELTRLIEK